MIQRAPCRTCGTDLHFGTDGHGGVTEACPHCDWGWKLRVRPVAPAICEHQDNPVACERCERKRAAIRAGIAAMPKKDRCRNGHPMTADNVRMRTNGRRACMTCYRNSAVLDAERKRARRRAA